MNKIVTFFDEQVVKSKDRNKTLEVFETLVKNSSDEEVLEASKCIAACPFGPSILLERYKGAITHDNVMEQYNTLTDLVTNMRNSGYSVDDHVNGVLECVNYLQNANAIMSSGGYVYEKAVKEFTENLDKIDRLIVLEGTRTVMSEDNVMETIMAKTQAEFDLAFTKAFLGPEENFTLESMNELMRLSNRYDEVMNDRFVLEADQSKLKQAAVKADEKSRELSGKIRKKTGDAKQTAIVASKAGGRFTALIGSTLGKLNNMQKEERLEAVLQGGMRRRLSTLIRTAIMTGAATAIHPALGAITLITSAGMHKRADVRLKQEMINEYEGEIKLTREKIRDAEAAGDRKKKYDLMRIENHLEQNIERIKSPIRMNKSKIRKG